MSLLEKIARIILGEEGEPTINFKSETVDIYDNGGKIKLDNWLSEWTGL